MLNSPQWRLGVILWSLAMLGVAVLAYTLLPQLVSKAPQPVALNVAIIAALAQSGILLMLAVWGGVALARPLGLGAPAIQAALRGSPVWPALKAQLLPASLAGMAGASVLLAAARMAPAELIALGPTVAIPLAAKVLYGGITEEVLMRWGLLTVVIWLPWRLLQKRSGLPRPGYVIGAILLVAVLFGVGHLPAVVAMGGVLSTPVVTIIVMVNAVQSVLYGLCYWRWGLEAAFIAHALTHVVFVVATSIS